MKTAPGPIMDGGYPRARTPVKVSVIIPVYNAASLVTEAVESALAQPETGQVILVDDGSQDCSLAVCRGLAGRHDRIDLLRHPGGGNHGAAASRNLGIRSARCEYIAFLDADDYYLPGRFRAARQAFESGPSVDGVYDAIGTIYDHDQVTAWYRAHRYPDLITLFEKVDPSRLFETLIAGDSGFFCTDGIVVRASIFDRTGEFDTSLRMCEDTAMWIKMSIVGRLVAGSITEPVGMRRLHANNTIFQGRDRNATYAARMAALLLRWGQEHHLPGRRLKMLADFLLDFRLCEIDSDAPYLLRKLSELSLFARFALGHPLALRSEHYRSVVAATIGWKRCKAMLAAARGTGAHNALSPVEVESRSSRQKVQ